MAVKKVHLTKKNIIIMVTAIIVFVVITIILLTIFITNWMRNRQIISKIVSPVAIITPISGDINKSIIVNGYINNESTIDIIPMVTGKITSLAVKEGATVKKGTLLALVDDSSLKVMLTQSYNAFKTAESSFKRVESLYGDKIASEQSYEIAKNNYEMAKSQYDAILLQYNWTKIVAPIDGIIVYIYGKVGALASPQMPIIRISNPKTVIVFTNIPDKYYEIFSKKYEDIDVFVKRPNSEDVLSAKILSIASFIDVQTKTFIVKSTFSSNVVDLIPGMFVKTEFILDSHKNIFMLPFETLVSGEKLWTIERDDNDKNIGYAKEIKFIPTYFNSNYFEIPQKFSKIEFICEGQDFIYENQKLKIVKKNGVKVTVEEVKDDNI